MTTLVGQLMPVLEECNRQRELRKPSHDASREFAIAATHLEDAIMRINRAFAKEAGAFMMADVEALTTDH